MSDKIKALLMCHNIQTEYIKTTFFKLDIEIIEEYDMTLENRNLFLVKCFHYHINLFKNSGFECDKFYNQ